MMQERKEAAVGKMIICGFVGVLQVLSTRHTAQIFSIFLFIFSPIDVYSFDRIQRRTVAGTRSRTM
jgi:hypothetical protein